MFKEFTMRRLKILLIIFTALTITLFTSCGVGFNLTPYVYTPIDSYDFGNTILTDSKYFDFKIENHGAASMIATYVSVEDSDGEESQDFTIDTLFDNDGDILKRPYTNILMNPKTKITIRVKFSPDSEGDFTGFLSVVHSASNKKSPLKIELKGSGKYMVNPHLLDFGKIVSNVKKTAELRIDNFHSEEILISKLSISTGSAFFQILSAKKNGLIDISAGYFATSLLPGEFLIVNIEASSPGLNTRTGAIAVYHDIANIHSPVYGNLKLTTQENYPPKIVSATTSKPVIKADASEFVTLNVKVSDPNGLSDISTVFADLTGLGDTIRQLKDDGTDGDSIKNDGVYSIRFTSKVTHELVGRVKINISVLDFNNAIATGIVEMFFYSGNILEVGVGSYPYNNLSSPLNAARDGDYILVHNGIYAGSSSTNIKFGGKQILMRSENGAEHTKLDCRNSGNGLKFDDLETEASIIQGFMITAANSSKGGAIYVGENCAPLILDCVFTNSKAAYGAGVYCDENSTPTIERCQIFANLTVNGLGGAIFLQVNSEPFINDCEIYDNRAQIAGGIYCSGASPNIVNTNIHDNVAVQTAGGIYIDNSPGFEMANCIVSSNSSTSHGAGMYILNSKYMIEKCSFENNITQSSGGGMILGTSNGRVINCKFVNNRSGSSGGAVYGSSGYMTFENCLVVNNNATSSGGGFALIGSPEALLHNNTISKNEAVYGGGIFNQSSIRTWVYNSIIWGNLASSGKEIYKSSGYINLENVNFSNASGNVSGTVNANAKCVYSSPQFEDLSTNSLSGTLTFNYNSNIVSGYNTKFLTEIQPGDLIYLDIDGVANAMTVAKIESNSQLVLMGKYRGTGGSDGSSVIHVNYRLKLGSPCINAGENAYVPVDLKTDLDGNDRIEESYVDIGVYEYQ